MSAKCLHRNCIVMLFILYYIGLVAEGKNLD